MRLDGWAGRGAALLVALAVGGTLAWIHRHDLFPQEAPAEAAESGPDPYRECVAQRAPDIDRMLSEKTIDAEKAGLFRSRMEAMCRAEATKAAGGTPGAAPALPPGMTPTRRF